MEEYETYGGWLKKLDTGTFFKIARQPLEHGWLVDDDGTLISIMVGYICISDEDGYQDRVMWADDNCEGYFYCETSYTSGGTPIVRLGDEVRIKFYFQKETDAFNFKMRWQ